MSAVVTLGKVGPYGLPVRGSVCAGPVEPYDDPSMFDDTTYRRSVSIARPGPTSPSQVPVVSSSSPGGAWPLR